MKRLFLCVSPALALLSGCGGSSTPGAQPTSYAGSYAANLTAPANSTLLVVLQTNGTGTAVIADSTGVLASGTATANGGTLTIGASGSGGSFQVTTRFGASNTATSQITGSGTDTNVNDILVAGSGKSPFAGTYTSGFTGSHSGTSSFVIDETGGLSGSGKDSLGNKYSFTGSSIATGLISFKGSVQVSGTTLTSSFTGSLYVTHVNNSVGPNILGAGTWSNPKGANGSWTASNVVVLR